MNNTHDLFGHQVTIDELAALVDIDTSEARRRLRFEPPEALTVFDREPSADRHGLRIHGRSWCRRVRIIVETPSGPKWKYARVRIAPSSVSLTHAIEMWERAVETHGGVTEAARHLSSQTEAPGVNVSVANLMHQWTSGALLIEYGQVYGLRPKKSARNDEWLLARCGAVVVRRARPATLGQSVKFGDLSVSDVQECDVLECFSVVVAGGSPSKKHHYRSALHRLFELAERPCRLRPDDTNPLKYINHDCQTVGAHDDVATMLWRYRRMSERDRRALLTLLTIEEP